MAINCKRSMNWITSGSDAKFITLSEEETVKATSTSHETNFSIVPKLNCHNSSSFLSVPTIPDQILPSTSKLSFTYR